MCFDEIQLILVLISGQSTCFEFSSIIPNKFVEPAGNRVILGGRMSERDICSVCIASIAQTLYN